MSDLNRWGNNVNTLFGLDVLAAIVVVSTLYRNTSTSIHDAGRSDFILPFFLLQGQKLSKNKKKKLKKKAKKQQQLLEMQINQMEQVEREGKPLIDVRKILCVLFRKGSKFVC